MKKTLLLLAMASTLAAAHAQPDRRGGDRGPRMTAEERQKMAEQAAAQRDADLRETLQLSDSLARLVDSVNRKYDRQQRELMSPESRSGNREAMRDQIENIQKAREAEVGALLTKEQLQKYDKYQKEQRSRQREGMEPRRSGGGPGRGPGGYGGGRGGGGF